MQLKELYDEAYKKFTPAYLIPENIAQIDQYLKENSSSLVDFVTQYRNQFSLHSYMQQSDCLEIGCGLGSVSFEVEAFFKSVTALDFSALAITAAKSIKSLKNSSVDFVLGDACDFHIDAQFPVILDSHLYHCLSDTKDRRNYLENVKKALAPGGKFFIETMVFHPQLEFPMEYFYDENKTLWKGDAPIRSIKTSLEIERELQDAGLKIEYLYYHSELSFCPYPEYPDYPFDLLPKTLRICTTLE